MFSLLSREIIFLFLRYADSKKAGIFKCFFFGKEFNSINIFRAVEKPKYCILNQQNTEIPAGNSWKEKNSALCEAGYYALRKKFHSGGIWNSVAQHIYLSTKKKFHTSFVRLEKNKKSATRSKSFWEKDIFFDIAIPHIPVN